MSIEQTLNDDLKQAMRAKNKDLLGCIRQVKTKVQETVNAQGFKGEIDDALHQRVIGSYIKSLNKGIDELGAAGDRGQPLRSKYQGEIDYLQKYLPEVLDAVATQALVDQAIADLGVTDPKQTGRVMGAIIKEHKGRVDAALVKQLVTKALGAD